MSTRGRGQASGSSGRQRLTASRASPYSTTGSTTSSASGSSGSSAALYQAQAESGYVSPYPPLTAGSTTSLTRSAAGTTAKGVKNLQRRTTNQPQPEESSDEESSEGPDDDDEVSPAAVPAQQRAQGQTRGGVELSTAQRQALITALNENRVNTIAELRRVYYVNSNSLLSELRGLTRNYPFSSDIIPAALSRVHTDASSNRNRNYAWLILAKIHTDRLIPVYARAQAARPEMWGGQLPSPQNVERLTQAVARMLRWWDGWAGGK